MNLFNRSISIVFLFLHWQHLRSPPLQTFDSLTFTHTFIFYVLRTRRTHSFTYRLITTRAVELEGFSIWWVAEYFNASDTDRACSPIVTVCATNMHKHHTWKFSSFTFQQEMIMAIQEGCSALTCIPSLRVSNVTRDHHATYAEWMQPFEVCITGISICSRSGCHHHCSVSLVAQQSMRSSHGNSTFSFNCSLSQKLHWKYVSLRNLSTKKVTLL